MTMKRVFTAIFSILLLIIGLIRHTSAIFSDLTGHIFGDAGDGFFNLWVMTQNANHFLKGTLQGILDGQVFYPNNAGTMLLSDTLYLPSILFAALEPFGLDGFSRFNIVALSLCCCAFLAHWFFFHFLWCAALTESNSKSSSPPLQPKRFDWTYLLVPGFTYVGSFSIGRSIYFMHFQNISSFWAVSAVAGCGGYLQFRRPAWLYLAMVSLVAANYSTQYFGVLVAIIILIFALCLLGEGSRTMLDFTKNHWLSICATAIAIAPIVILYGSTHGAHGTDLPRNVMGFTWRELLRPVSGTGAFNFLNPKIGPLPGTNHELPAYLGFSLIAALFAIFYSTFGIWHSWLFSLARHRAVQVFAIALAVVASLPSYRQWTARPALVILTVAALGSIVAGWKWRTKAKISPIGFYLIAVAIAVYGLAFGPSHFYRNFQPDASLWGIWAWLIPGVHKMRAVGRMAPIGQIILLGLVAWFLFRRIAREASPRIRTLFFTIALFLMFLQAAEHDSDLYITTPSPAVLTTLPAEEEYFGALQGPILAFPVSPFHISTYAMLYFTHFPNIYLMNGYSGSATPRYYELMASGAPEMPSDKQISMANQVGVDTFVVFKELISDSQLAELMKKWNNKAFDNNRFYVFKSKQEDSHTNAVSDD